MGSAGPHIRYRGLNPVEVSSPTSVAPERGRRWWLEALATATRRKHIQRQRHPDRGRRQAPHGHQLRRRRRPGPRRRTTTSLVVNGKDGNDRITVGNDSNTLDDIEASVTV